MGLNCRASEAAWGFLKGDDSKQMTYRPPVDYQSDSRTIDELRKENAELRETLAQMAEIADVTRQFVETLLSMRESKGGKAGNA